MSSSSVINNITKDVLFVSFSGSKFGMASMTFFEFKNFLEENFKIFDKHFFIDHKVLWYNQGIQDISTDMDGTVEHLRTLIEGYKKVVFIGASAGGYTAILCGSILNVDVVIAFRPQTDISIYEREGLDPRYSNIKPFMNTNTKYYAYGDSAITDRSDLHSVHHCEHIEDLPNVSIHKEDNFDIKEYRNSGKLAVDFSRILAENNIIIPNITSDGSI